jgi:hypothetical protein
MHPMLNIAVRAARKAGNLIAKHYETPDSVETSQKGSNDFVTNVDKAAEAMIMKPFANLTRSTPSSPKKAVNTQVKIRMFNGLSIHWMAPPTSSNVCRTSPFPSPYASKAVLKSRWFTIQCVTNCSRRPVVRAHS